MHVLFECTLYEEERERWRGGYVRVVWNSRQRHEGMRDFEWE